MTWQVIEADCVEQMKLMDEASVDAICTDPPYGLEFMGKEWDRLAETPGYNERGRITDRPDSQVPYGRGGGVNSYQAGRPMQEWHQAWATEALRVLKPGGFLLAAGGTRTFHRLVSAIEDAGFEIRDCIAHMYGSGFPKSLNVGNGRGTALKPAFEPWTLARKPLVGTVAQNVERFGTGALNVDACRIGSDVEEMRGRSGVADEGNRIYGSGVRNPTDEIWEPQVGGRWPANVALSHLPECQRVGERRVKNPGGVPSADSEKDSAPAFTSPERTSTVHHFAPDGLETVEAWSCAPGCPVAKLDRQTEGKLAVTGRYRDDYELEVGKRGGGNDAVYGKFDRSLVSAPKRGNEYANERGGASRFFATFSGSDDGRVDLGPIDGYTDEEAEAMEAERRITNQPRFRYVAKASRQERTAGVGINAHPT